MLRASIRAQLSTPRLRSTTQPPSGPHCVIWAGVRIGARSVLLSASRPRFGSNAPVTQSRNRVTLTTFMPQTSLLVAMDFSESEPGQMIMEHALVGLSREELFNPLNWAYGGPLMLQQRGYNGPERGLIVEP